MRNVSPGMLARQEHTLPHRVSASPAPAPRAPAWPPPSLCPPTYTHLLSWPGAAREEEKLQGRLPVPLTPQESVTKSSPGGGKAEACPERWLPPPPVRLAPRGPGRRPLRAGESLGHWSEPPTSTIIPEISRLPPNFTCSTSTNELNSVPKAASRGPVPAKGSCCLCHPAWV